MNQFTFTVHDYVVARFHWENKLLSIDKTRAKICYVGREIKKVHKHSIQLIDKN